LDFLIADCEANGLDVDDYIMERMRKYLWSLHPTEKQIEVALDELRTSRLVPGIMDEEIGTLFSVGCNVIAADGVIDDEEIAVLRDLAGEFGEMIDL